MNLNRREFVLLAAAACAGCGGGEASRFPALRGIAVDLGPATDYAPDGVYDHSRDQGLFIVRQGGTLRIVSAICTHRGCRLNEAPDGHFACKCHGSEFSSQGQVIEGPATKDLPILPFAVNPAGNLVVNG